MQAAHVLKVAGEPAPAAVAIGRASGHQKGPRPRHEVCRNHGPRSRSLPAACWQRHRSNTARASGVCPSLEFTGLHSLGKVGRRRGHLLQRLPLVGVERAARGGQRGLLVRAPELAQRLAHRRAHLRAPRLAYAQATAEKDRPAWQVRSNYTLRSKYTLRTPCEHLRTIANICEHMRTHANNC